jgi:excisionase family DNA binding protein
MPTRKRPGRAGASAPTWSTTQEEQDAAVASNDADGTNGGIATDPYVTVDEAAELLRVVPKTVRNRIRSGDLEAYRHGRRIIIPRAAIKRLNESGRM